MPDRRETAVPFARLAWPLLALLALAACAPPPAPTFEPAPEPTIAAPPPKPKARQPRQAAAPIPAARPADLEADRVVAQAIERVHAPLAAFRREPPGSCDSANLMIAEMWAGGFADSFRRPSTVGQRRLYGGLALDVADAAREGRCPDAASRLYDAVLGTYVDADYAEIRQRALQGRAALAP